MLPLDRLLAADDLGVRLEIVGGLPIWEAHPLPKHQRAVDRIRATITPPAKADGNGWAGVHLASVYIKFPDGSLRRPDVSIFCREPDEDDAAITLVPAAVIEVISKGYEAKGLEIGPRFYLSQGVKDVVVFDPDTLVVLHVYAGGATRHVSPVPIKLQCGCRCTV
jgi:Uma2 family endonuclease